MKKITLKIPIAQLVLEYPESAEILMKYGFHCVWCGFSQYESLGEGAEIHGIPKKEQQKLLAELNKLINKRKGTHKKQVKKK